MLLVHAGNRVDGPGASEPRFPERQVPAVSERLHAFVGALRPRVVVSAAAAGADLLLLEAALQHAADTHVVLPFGAEQFRAASVADRGDVWLHRYDRVLEQVQSRAGCHLVEHAEPAEAAGYRQGNRHLLDHADAVAGADGILALAVRPRPDGRAASVTDDFAQRAAQRGRTVIDIDPSVRLEDRPTAFVVMPFGEKPFAGRTVDCDETYRRLIVPLLEDADLDWVRADRQLDTGIVHVGMLERLGNADVVVVDTICENPNVYYELGMRHALADKVTLLLGPQGTSPPFDTRPVRHFTYSLPGARLEDRAALEALAALQPVLAEALTATGQDSPLYYFFARTREPLRAHHHDQQQHHLLVDLHDQVQSARHRCDGDALRQLTGLVQQSALPRDERRQLLLLLGTGLRETEHYEAAVDVLEPLAYRPTEGSYSLWMQQLALALRRRGERAEAADEDPERFWRRAQQLLQDVLVVIGSDPETCGIAAGLAKQRARRALDQGLRTLARAHLEEAARLYVQGAEAAPTDYYTTLNAATTLRVLAQHLHGADRARADARRLLPVAEYFAERSWRAHPRDFWAAVTVAECALTRHLLDGTPTGEEVVLAYARATTLAPNTDAVRSVVNQLQLYRLAGDPDELLQQITDTLGAGPA